MPHILFIEEELGKYTDSHFFLYLKKNSSSLFFFKVVFTVTDATLYRTIISSESEQTYTKL